MLENDTFRAMDGFLGVPRSDVGRFLKFISQLASINPEKLYHWKVLTPPNLLADVTVLGYAFEEIHIHVRVPQNGG
jgi:hypothetical protein